jgi:hypothetical protein
MYDLGSDLNQNGRGQGRPKLGDPHNYRPTLADLGIHDRHVAVTENSEHLPGKVVMVRPSPSAERRSRYREPPARLRAAGSFHQTGVPLHAPNLGPRLFDYTCARASASQSARPCNIDGGTATAQ